jgi:hypothetical protein
MDKKQNGAGKGEVPVVQPDREPLGPPPPQPPGPVKLDWQEQAFCAKLISQATIPTSIAEMVGRLIRRLEPAATYLAERLGR